MDGHGGRWVDAASGARGTADGVPARRVGLYLALRKVSSASGALHALLPHHPQCPEPPKPHPPIGRSQLGWQS